MVGGGLIELDSQSSLTSLVTIVTQIPEIKIEFLFRSLKTTKYDRHEEEEKMINQIKRRFIGFQLICS